MCFRPGEVDTVLSCPNCGQMNASIATTCIKCGAPLGEGSAAADAAPGAPAAPSAPSAPNPDAPKAPGAPAAPSAPTARKRGPVLPGSAPTVHTPSED